MAVVSLFATEFCHQYESTTMAVVSPLLMEKIIGSKGAFAGCGLRCKSLVDRFGVLQVVDWGSKVAGCISKVHVISLRLVVE